MSYVDELGRAMVMVAQQPKAVFVGQGVGVPSTVQTDTLREVPSSQRIEFPVAEDLQMGFCTGLALEGWLPVCVYPRNNFLIMAANQLVNHLAVIQAYSSGKNGCLGKGYSPKVIIRSMVPSTSPFDPGHQHDGDFTDAIEMMVGDHIVVQRLESELDVVPAYMAAIKRARSTILFEYHSLYKGSIPSGVMG